MKHCRMFTKSSEIDDVITLVKGAQEREPEALLELLRRFAPLLSKWQRLLTEQIPHEDEEILHSEVRFAFVMLVLEFDVARGVPFEGYVDRMIAHRLADQRRREWRAVTLTFSEVAVALGIEGDDVLDCMHASSIVFGAVDSLPDACWCALWWQETICHLTPRQRVVMELIRQGQSEQEIALSLGLRQQTVHQSKHEARKKLQKFWC
jgi:RNA polymerase sigma factor (sigma-70 family)